MMAGRDTLSSPLIFWAGSPEGKELSNAYVQDFVLPLACGMFRFSSAEAAYQCLKQPKLSKGKIAVFQIASPWAARQYGRLVPLRPDWSAVKDEMMYHVLRAKFSDPALSRVLLSTGTRYLIHWQPDDVYWGTGPGGFGKNRLGTLLMRLRNESLTPADLDNSVLCNEFSKSTQKMSGI